VYGIPGECHWLSWGRVPRLQEKGGDGGKIGNSKQGERMSKVHFVMTEREKLLNPQGKKKIEIMDG